MQEFKKFIKETNKYVVKRRRSYVKKPLLKKKEKVGRTFNIRE